MNCHPDRSEAKWRDLLFFSTGRRMYMEALPFRLSSLSEVEWGSALLNDIAFP